MDFIALRNSQAADTLCERIEASLALASEHPYMFKRSERMAGMREIVVYPNYLVFYQVSSRAIEVTGVIHARRDYP